MRDFNEADKKKKARRVRIPENPAKLPPEKLDELGQKVKQSLREGYLPCPAAWKIALDAGVPKIAVGEITDRLGVRVTDCQIGCFKVDKALHEDLIGHTADEKTVALLEDLSRKNDLTCATVFELAKKLNLKPLALADMASLKDIRVRQCQLGCF